MGFLLFLILATGFSHFHVLVFLLMSLFVLWVMWEKGVVVDPNSEQFSQPIVFSRFLNPFFFI